MKPNSKSDPSFKVSTTTLTYFQEECDVILFKSCQLISFIITHLDGVSGVRKPLDPLGDKECHLPRPGVPDRVHEDLGAVILSLPPGVWPTKDDSVGLHPSKATSLNPEMENVMLIMLRLINDEIYGTAVKCILQQDEWSRRNLPKLKTYM